MELYQVQWKLLRAIGHIVTERYNDSWTPNTEANIFAAEFILQNAINELENEAQAINAAGGLVRSPRWFALRYAALYTVSEHSPEI